VVPGAEMMAPVHILWSMKSVIDLPFFDIAFPREVIQFFGYDPQGKLTKRKVVSGK
jgi:hypothetical protein